MELRDSIRILRQELGVTQAELATSLHIATLTVSRWELGKARPNRAVTSLLLGYAYTHNVKRSTTDMLREALSNAPKKAPVNNAFAGMMAVEHTSLCECFDAFPFPLYVCDISTDIILYANKLALTMIDTHEENNVKQKCYECLMHKTAPCDFCNKATLSEDEFTPYKTVCDSDGKEYITYGKLIRWNGHNAQIRLIIGFQDNQ